MRPLKFDGNWQRIHGFILHRYLGGTNANPSNMYEIHVGNFNMYFVYVNNTWRHIAIEVSRFYFSNRIVSKVHPAGRDMSHREAYGGGGFGSAVCECTGTRCNVGARCVVALHSYSS